MTRSSKKKVGTLKTINDAHSDIRRAEEAADVLSVDHLAPTLLAVSEGEELVVEDSLATTNQSASRLPDAPSRRPDEVVIHLRTLVNTDTPDLGVI